MSLDLIRVYRDRDTGERGKNVFAGTTNALLAFTNFIATFESRGFRVNLPEKKGNQIIIKIGLGVNTNVIVVTLTEIDRGNETTNLIYDVEAYRSGDRDYRDKR